MATPENVAGLAWTDADADYEVSTDAEDLKLAQWLAAMTRNGLLTLLCLTDKSDVPGSDGSRLIDAAFAVRTGGVPMPPAPCIAVNTMQ